MRKNIKKPSRQSLESLFILFHVNLWRYPVQLESCKTTNVKILVVLEKDVHGSNFQQYIAQKSRCITKYVTINILIPWKRVRILTFVHLLIPTTQCLLGKVSAMYAQCYTMPKMTTNDLLWKYNDICKKYR